MEKNVKKTVVIPLIITIVVIGILYYVTIPPINIQSVQFWNFLIWCLIIIAVCFGIPRAHDASTSFISDFIEGINREGLGYIFKFRERRAARKQAKADGDKSAVPKRSWLFWIIAVVIFLFLGIFVGQIASSPLFNARAYSGLLEVKEGNFAEDISEISMKSVPVVDRDTAVRLGSRTIGEMSDLVSQFAIDEGPDAYTQINYESQPYRVSPLIYADPIKWIMNTWEGLPGFVTVNMATQDTQLVRLPEGHYMHISTGEHFNNYLYRYVRFQFPFEIFGEAAFELNDEGEPYWIVPTVKMRIGLFGGEDYDGAILVNACTGETTKYDLADVPNWCDKVFTADLVYEQLGYYGKYRSGFINSLIGQTGVLVPTGSPAPGLFNNDSSSSSGVGGGYNYLAINDDVYMYTGMTSANSDESLVGFALVNLRTKEPRYYTCAGATESSAMSSAEGQVQQMSYNATFPLLLNIADRPTYFLSLKDAAGLVKMYAFVDVQQYQIVGTGSTVADAQNAYIAALTNDDQVEIDEGAIAESGILPSVDGQIEAIESVVFDGNTRYYFKLAGDPKIYIASISANENMPFLGPGSRVSVMYTEKDNTREVTARTLL